MELARLTGGSGIVHPFGLLLGKLGIKEVRLALIDELVHCVPPTNAAK